jgi:glycosyltransferase involved in cell wall biosynthesis
MGGISQYILQLLSALAKIDKENEYLIFHSRKDGRSYLPPNSPNFQRVDLWTPCHHRVERWSLSAELLPHRLDVFHSPDFIPPQWGGKREVVTVHDLNFVYYPEFLTAESRRYYAGQIDWAVAHADHISADSEQTRRDLIERLGVGAEKVTAVHLAANPVYSKPLAEEAIRQTLDEFNLERGYLLFVGTLEPRKNVPLLLRVYHQLLQERTTDKPLVLVGRKGWLFEEIFETISALGLGEKVRHLSGVNDERLAHLYSAAGVLALPSYYEGFGLPPLEAMHCGCPVVVSDRGSLPEIVGKAGIILAPDEQAGWVEALGLVLTDSEQRARMIRAGLEQAKRFNWETAARQTLGIYQGMGNGG